MEMSIMRYVFPPYTLDTSTNELFHDTLPVHVEPQVFRLLLYLLEHAPALVTRQELTRHLWPNTYVSNAALLYAITAARRAIGDTGHTQRHIKTLHRRGYRWSGPVTRVPTALPDP